MKNRIFSAGAVFILSVISASCAVTLRGSFQDQCKAEGWTNEQCDVAFYDGVRQKFTKENGNGGYEPTYNTLTREQALLIFDARLQDLDGLLDYKNQDEAKFIKEYGLRDYLERQEKIFKADRGRLQYVDNYTRFQEYMGELSSAASRHLDRFSTANIFVEDLATAYPFASAQIEQARASGSLKEVERVAWFSERVLGKKEPDPNDPNDPNKFVWKPVKIGVEFVSYKIMDGEQPKDNSVEYVEGTRLEIIDNGRVRRETKPSLKMFVPGNGYNSVVVIDKDKEGEVGFLLPDFVDRVGRIGSAEGLMSEAVFSRLFYEQESHKRIPPKDPPPITVEIAPVGKTKVDVWETNANGWTVPMKYKNDRADNYSVDHKLKGSDSDEFDHSGSKQVEYFRKTWESNGRVMEYFYPKPPYDQPNMSQISVYGKDIRLVTVEGEVVQGVITPNSNKFLQDKPYAISYTQAERRWTIRDEDGDGKYEKKREIFEAGEK